MCWAVVAKAIRERRELEGRLLTAALLLPAVLFLIFFFIVPLGAMIGNSFYLESADGGAPAGPTLENYARFFSGELYWRVLGTTLRISLVTTLLAAVMGYPVALVIARGHPVLARVVMVLVIAPLLVNIVIRTFGWRIILGRTGVLNWALGNLGLIDAPLDVLYNELAVVIGSLHVFFPLMVMPLASAIGRVERPLEEAAATLGATRAETFLKVVLPLSLPGLAAGATLVFTLTFSSFVMPAILGGDFAKMLGTLVEEQILGVFDWSFGATIATVMLVINMAVVMGYTVLVERRIRRYAPMAS